ncbi:MAG: hypothetical protein WKG07_01085 [Hymenobacter sp.]
MRPIRPDRPGQSITPGVLRPGEFQLETGWQRFAPGGGVGLPSQATTLRIGFFSSLELRLTQNYVFGPARRAGAGRGRRPYPHPAARLHGLGPAHGGREARCSRPTAPAASRPACSWKRPWPVPGSVACTAAPGAPVRRLLLSQRLGRRAALDGNFGFSQPGLTAHDALAGQYLGSLALTAPITNNLGYFVEAYGRGHQQLTTGTTAGLYYRPWVGLRFDATLGRVLGGWQAGRHYRGPGPGPAAGRQRRPLKPDSTLRGAQRQPPAPGSPVRQAENRINLPAVLWALLHRPSHALRQVGLSLWFFLCVASLFYSPGCWWPALPASALPTAAPRFRP